MPHVSVTGFTITARFGRLRFFAHAVPLLGAARRAEGCLFADARSVGGVEHTLSVWESRGAMLAFMRSPAHVRAMAASPRLGHGRTLGYAADRTPDWGEALARWRAEARDYSAPDPGW